MAVSQYDFVNVESGTDETYVPLDQENEVYDVNGAIDEINGTIVNGDTEQKLDYLADTKELIREAIINKGQPVEETASFRSYAESIGELTGEINNQDVLITENGTYEAESGYTGLGEVTVEVAPVLEDKVVTENGTYRAGSGYDGLGTVVVNTPVVNNQNMTITENGFYEAESGYSGLGEVTVNVPEPVLNTLNVTQNGTYTPPANVDGYNQVLVSVADIPAVIDPLSVTPSTSQQVITASTGIDGFSPITVAAVTSAIDSNIQSGNIKSGVSILGVAGSVEELHGLSLTVTPSTSGQWLQPQGDYNAFDDVFVNAVDSTIDSNIQAGNIKSGVSILGVNGSVVELNGAETTVAANTYDTTYRPLAPKNGFTKVTVSAVTSAIDSNIQAENIKEGVTILGVTGNYSSGSTRFGASINDIFGEVTSGLNWGYLEPPASVPALTFTGVRSLRDCPIAWKWYGATMTGDVSFPDLTEISGSYEFSHTFYVTKGDGNRTLSFAALTTIASSGVAENFNYCLGQSQAFGTLSMPVLKSATGGGMQLMAYMSYLVNVYMPELEIVGGSSTMYGAFQRCTKLVNVNMNSLRELAGVRCLNQTFAYTYLEEFKFYSLESVTADAALTQTFAHIVAGNDSTKAFKLYFYALNPNSFISPFGTALYSVMSDMCNDTLVEIHFPSNMLSTISQQTGYATQFGGKTGSSILFDLPATVTLVGTNNYMRNPKFDTASALAWYDTSSTMATPYYTSGTTDPTVNSAIYSDSACTTQVDTVASIS